MKSLTDLFAAMALAVGLSLSWGCAAMLMQHQGAKDLSPEQIDAYNKVGANVFACLTVGGPPPAGNTVWVILPKGVPINWTFGDNCHIISK